MAILLRIALRNNHGMSGGGRRRDLVFMGACGVVLALTLGAVLSIPQAAETSDPFPEIGYEMSPTALSETFSSPGSALSIRKSNAVGSQLTYSDEGLKINFDQNATSVSINKPSLRADSVRLLVDVSSLDANHSASLRANFLVADDPQWYYGVKVLLSYSGITLYPNVWLGEGTPPMPSMTFVYDVKQRGVLDIAIEVRDGDVIVGVDGLESVLENDFKTFGELSFGGVVLTSDELRWSSPASVVLKRLDIGHGADVEYHDRLHKTITPWGHDFTLTMQIHADGANPAQLTLLKYLADNYGVRGEFSAWMNTSQPEISYSILTDANYSDAVSALQDSAWDIGVHGVTSGATKRAELIRLIDLFEAEFGPLVSWVDHGALPQDIWQEGNDPSSEYYISDVLVNKNVMIWVNEEWHSHSSFQDLNLDDIVYNMDEYPGLDLLKTSEFGFLAECTGWQTAFAPVTREELAERQRIYAVNNAVIIWHDYTGRFTYVEDGGVNYSSQSLPQMGYPYEIIKSAGDTNKYSNGTWHLIPAAEDYFAAMSEYYDVWYATPREIYDRSIGLEQLIVDESAHEVTITNPTSADIEGVTLFTKSQPWYGLRSGSSHYTAQKGAENVMFVIPEVKAGATLVLSKERASPPAQAATDASSAFVSGDAFSTLHLEAEGRYLTSLMGMWTEGDDAVARMVSIGATADRTREAVPVSVSRPS
jgi:hypothetical protein